MEKEELQAKIKKLESEANGAYYCFCRAAASKSGSYLKVMTEKRTEANLLKAQLRQMS